jgi:hypothetical protein
MANDIIMVSFSMLYCGVCPLATLLIFGYFCITQRLEEFQDLNVFTRPVAVQKPIMGIFGSIVELLVVFIIVLNSLMLYIVSPSFKKFLPENQILQLLTVFGIEHILIVFLMVLRIGIDDVPKFVKTKMDARLRKSKNKSKPAVDEHELARKIIREY